MDSSSGVHGSRRDVPGPHLAVRAATLADGHVTKDNALSGALAHLRGQGHDLWEALMLLKTAELSVGQVATMRGVCATGAFFSLWAWVVLRIASLSHTVSSVCRLLLYRVPPCCTSSMQ